MKFKYYIYTIIFLSIIFFDQFTKYLAINNYLINYNFGFLSFDLTINRGVSWGLLHSSNNYIFYLVNLIILLIIIFFSLYIKDRLKNNSIIIPEIFILSGAISNFIDRILHAGVIDFILITILGYSWPLFNIADFFIVFGALILLMQLR